MKEKSKSNPNLYGNMYIKGDRTLHLRNKITLDSGCIYIDCKNITFRGNRNYIMAGRGEGQLVIHKCGNDVTAPNRDCLDFYPVPKICGRE